MVGVYWEGRHYSVYPNDLAQTARAQNQQPTPAMIAQDQQNKEARDQIELRVSRHHAAVQ